MYALAKSDWRHVTDFVHLHYLKISQIEESSIWDALQLIKAKESETFKRNPGTDNAPHNLKLSGI